MFIEAFQSAAGSKIAVTNTATNIFDLINTAQSTALANAGFSSGVNAIIIQPEDGDVRILFNGTPTSVNGFLIPSGAIATLCNVPLKAMKLIRTGGSNVTCSIQIGKSDLSESSAIIPSGGSAITSVITSVVPGTGATNLGKAEDAAHTSGDTGVQLLAVRKDTAAALAGTDGDYAPLEVDANGRLHVNTGLTVDTSTLALETGGNLDTVATNTGAIKTAVETLDNAIKAEDSAHTSGDTGVQLLAVRKDTAAALAGTDGDYAPLEVDANGRLHVNTGLTVDTSTLALETGGNLDTVATNTGAIKTAVETLNNAISGSEMQVDIVGALPAGTNAIGKLAANSGVDIGDVDVLSVPSSIQGPGNPVIDSYATVAINLTTGANQVLVSSAADKQIWVYGYAFTCGDADGQTVSLQDEDDTALTGIMEFKQYGGISVPPSGNFAMPVFKCATDKDLEIDITGGDVDGWLAYAIVSV